MEARLQTNQHGQKRSLYLCYDYLRSVAKDLESQSDPKENEAQYNRDHKNVEELEQHLKEVIEHQDQIEAHYTILKQIYALYKNMDQQQRPSLEEFTQQIENLYEEKKQSFLQSKSYDEESLRNNQQYIDFKTAVWDVHHDEPLPWQEDEDIIVGTQDTSAVSSLICPITKMTFEEPVKCVLCNHTYEKEAIIGLIGRRRQTECPVAGCNATVSRDDLEADVEMETRVQRAKEREEYQKSTQNNNISSISLEDDDEEPNTSKENADNDNNDAELDLL